MYVLVQRVKGVIMYQCSMSWHEWRQVTMNKIYHVRGTSIYVIKKDHNKFAKEMHMLIYHG